MSSTVHRLFLAEPAWPLCFVFGATGWNFGASSGGAASSMRTCSLGRGNRPTCSPLVTGLTFSSGNTAGFFSFSGVTISPLALPMAIFSAGVGSVGVSLKSGSETSLNQSLRLWRASGSASSSSSSEVLTSARTSSSVFLSCLCSWSDNSSLSL